MWNLNIRTKRSRCIGHRLSYEKDLYKKVRIHCVNGRTLPCRQGYEKDIRYCLQILFFFYDDSISAKCDLTVFII